MPALKYFAMSPADISVSPLTKVAPGVVACYTHDSDIPSDLLSPSTAQQSTPAEGEEQALESHEVIELQTFSERKAWIEEKIKVNIIFIRVLQVTHRYLVS